MSGLPNAWGKENENLEKKKNHCDQNKPTFIEFIKQRKLDFFTGEGLLKIILKKRSQIARLIENIYIMLY